MSRLRSNRRDTSSRRASASRCRSRASDERRLATRPTARKANNATQFCESAIVKVPTGGSEKKLKQSIATRDVVTATHIREDAATNSTTSRYESATVVAFVTWSHSK